MICLLLSTIDFLNNWKKKVIGAIGWTVSQGKWLLQVLCANVYAVSVKSLMIGFVSYYTRIWCAFVLVVCFVVKIIWKSRCYNDSCCAQFISRWKWQARVTVQLRKGIRLHSDIRWQLYFLNVHVLEITKTTLQQCQNPCSFKNGHFGNILFIIVSLTGYVTVHNDKLWCMLFREKKQHACYVML